MIVIMQPGADLAQTESVIQRVRDAGLSVHRSEGVMRTIIGVIGDDSTKEQLRSMLEAMDGVERVVKVLQPFKLVSREYLQENTVVDVGNARFGGPEVVMIAGPCSVESRDQTLTVARAVKAAGATVLRGGAFKPRTSPYSFQGLEEEGLRILADARAETGLPVVTEAMDSRSLELVLRYCNMVQIGARNMQNYTLLREAGRAGAPVLLKRGPSATLEEFLLAAEYVASEGNGKIVLCERGLRAFDGYTRFTLDISAVPVLKKLTHLPVIVDPSHAAGKRDYVAPLARAAVAAGADGLIVEVHNEPEKALSDGPQQLREAEFGELMRKVATIATAIGRTVPAVSRV
ncbi:MAG: 3-deoxy-7-phosphoheptulonate synthase [Armatimonadetes bacterium]|nr:3-deoxy-7-phosphoheptulonate synthase [Armatimonadota bacterium]